MSDNEQRAPSERAAAEGASWGFWKIVGWVGGGAFGLLVLGVAAFALVALLGGGLPGAGSRVQAGTAASRPTEWLADPAIVHSSLPNVVILAVMEEESAGQVFAQNYNCTLGPALPKPCEEVYPGGLVKTRSEDAGLMQINSGGWPVPQDAAKWKALGIAADPFDPAANIAAGVAELQADMAKYHYLEYALEAYNSGSGGPHSKDAAYAQAVLADIQRYEAEPTVDVWSPLPYGPWVLVSGVRGYVHSYVVSSSRQDYWILGEFAAPYGASFSIPWAPRPPVCTAKSGKPVCNPSSPAMLTGRALVPPQWVRIGEPGTNGQSLWDGGSEMPEAGRDAPVWPGGKAWAIQEHGSTVWTVEIKWPAVSGSNTNIDFVTKGYMANN